MKSPSNSTAISSILEMLREDHEKVKILFEEFEDAKGSAAKEKIADTAIKELEIHAALEEELIYPTIRPEIDDDDLMNQAVEEHHVVHLLIAELKKMKTGDDRFNAKFTVLAEHVRQHIKEEETKMFPQAEKIYIDWETLQAEMMERKEPLRSKTAPPSKNLKSGASKKR